MPVQPQDQAHVQPTPSPSTSEASPAQRCEGAALGRNHHRPDATADGVCEGEGGHEAEAGTPLVRDVILRDGTPLRVRTPTPEDYDDIRSLYDGLSDESRYSRFHGYAQAEFPARMDAEADGDERLVLLGWHADRVVASGSYDRLGEQGVAEVAFTVADDFQGRGVGTRILEHLVEIGAARGVERFDAEVIGSNRAMLRVFERAGAGVRSQGAVDELLVSMDIAPEPPQKASVPS
jgi:RimJ/RimL family protein N-acetyltransferase